MSVISEVVEVGGSGAYAGLAAAPEFNAGPAPTGPPPLGSWGRGVPYDPSAGRPELLRRLLSPDWVPALRALVPPTAVLLLVPLLLAVPEDVIGGGYPFSNRFGAALALAVAAFGAPLHSASRGSSVVSYETDMRLLPLTVLVLWLAALWLGLRPALRSWRARSGGELTARRALLETARVAGLAGLVALLLGAAAGTTTGERSSRYLDDLGADDSGRFGLSLGARRRWTPAGPSRRPGRCSWRAWSPSWCTARTCCAGRPGSGPGCAAGWSARSSRAGWRRPRSGRPRWWRPWWCWPRTACRRTRCGCC